MRVRPLDFFDAYIDGLQTALKACVLSVQSHEHMPCRFTLPREVGARSRRQVPKQIEVIGGRPILQKVQCTAASLIDQASAEDGKAVQQQIVILLD